MNYSRSTPENAEKALSGCPRHDLSEPTPGLAGPLERTVAPAAFAAPGEGTFPRIAVCLPCCNEVLEIEKVIRDFRPQLPTAEIHVYDNTGA